MTDQLAVTGLIATTPRHIVTSEGLAITSFRLASHQRWFDRKVGRWSDGETNWYTVTAFRDLAVNASQSLHKGDRSGTSVEVEADSLGHDLHWGVSDYTKVARTILEEEPDDDSESDDEEEL